ncbi:hypothetical protein TNCV_1550041 [Trichonephila clavipes]|nr:hypothetical protein TNCV_1550041 [Trichonephila clavipes]
MADCEVEGTIASPLSIPLERAMSPTGEGETNEGTSELDRIRLDRKRGRRASAKQKYNESRLVDHARFNDETGENHNDETDNENHNDDFEIINGESIPIYSFIVLKIFIYDGLSRGNCCYCEHIKDGPCFNGATSAQNC